MVDNVALSLGVSVDRAETIRRVVTSIIRADHSDEERIDKIRHLFPRNEECIYAIYLLTPEKEEVAKEMARETPEDKMDDGTDMA